VEQERGEVRAADGRLVVFHLAGPVEAPLLIFHTGTPGHPYLSAELIEACVARDLRVACIARPGYAGSDRLRGRSYADNPMDTAAVADALRVRAFLVWGHSGGGGPALADGAKLGNRVRAVAVTASFAPRLAMGRGWWMGLDEANGPELRAIQAGEPALRKLFEERTERMREIKKGEQITGDPEFRRFYSAVDRQCFTGDFLEFQVRSYQLIGNDSVNGWIDDDFALYGDWWFDLATIAVPVTIWQGEQDNIIPIAHGQWLADHVPDA
jgi:pimeloyl-ACP methyl ester carboxylesterase